VLPKLLEVRDRLLPKLRSTGLKPSEVLEWLLDEVLYNYVGGYAPRETLEERIKNLADHILLWYRSESVEKLVQQIRQISCEYTDPIGNIEMLIDRYADVVREHGRGMEASRKTARLVAYTIIHFLFHRLPSCLREHLDNLE